MAFRADVCDRMDARAEVREPMNPNLLRDAVRHGPEVPSKSGRRPWTSLRRPVQTQSLPKGGIPIVDAIGCVRMETALQTERQKARRTTRGPK